MNDSSNADSTTPSEPAWDDLADRDTDPFLTSFEREHESTLPREFIEQSSKALAAKNKRENPTTPDIPQDAAPFAWIGASIAYDELPMPEPINWLVEDLMYLGGVYAHVGKPKTGKTMGARTLAAAVSSEFVSDIHTFMGRSVMPGSVLYVDFENPRNIARASFDRLNEDGYNMRFLRVLLAEPTPTSLSHGMSSLVGYCEGVRPKLIVLDGLLGFARIENLNDYAEVHPIIQELRNVAGKYDCAILFQHHGRKSGGADGDQSLGSVALPGQLDGMLSFTKNLDVHYVETATMREGQPIEKSAVVHSGEALVLDGDHKARQYVQEQREQRDNLRAYVADHGEVKLSDFRSGWGSYKKTRAGLQWLVDRGELHQQGKPHSPADPIRFTIEPPS